ncbi:MAG: DJ-1/PfpI family protein, partial [Gammaproteobacteria bacterium]
MVRVLVPLAEGFEELEAITIVDLLRRADIEVVTAGLRDGPVRASRQITVVPDTTLDEALSSDYDMVVLPGGLPGADHLAADQRVNQLLRQMADTGRYIAAICAAPKVLAGAGLLEGKRATAFPGVLDDAPGVIADTAIVVKDGK